MTLIDISLFIVIPRETDSSIEGPGYMKIDHSRIIPTELLDDCWNTHYDDTNEEDNTTCNSESLFVALP